MSHGRRLGIQDPAALAWVAILVAVGTSQIADLLTFLRMIAAHGAEAEANPVVALAASAGQLVPLIVIKVALVVLITAIYTLLSGRYRLLGSLVATLAVLAGIVGAFSNVAVITG